MIHLVWSGKGFLVVVFAFGFSLMANLISNSVTDSGVYWDTHKWPVAISLFIFAVACWMIGRRLPTEEPRILLDPKTGKEVRLRKSHTFFFIPVMWWGPILAAFGMIALGTDFVK